MRTVKLGGYEFEVAVRYYMLNRMSFCGNVLRPAECLDHLTDVSCNYAYAMGVSERDGTLYVLKGDALLGSCQVRLAEHNYCGFNATAIEITVSKQDQVLCGSQRTLDICPGCSRSSKSAPCRSRRARGCGDSSP